MSICRQLDKLGRIVLPSSMRKRLMLKPYNLIDIEMVDDKILLKKHKPLDDIHLISPQPLEIFHAYFGIPVVLCDCIDPIQSFGCEHIKHIQLTPSLKNALKSTNPSSERDISILISDVEKTVEKIIPIRVKYRLIGAILLLSSDRLIEATACATYIAKHIGASIDTN